MKKIVFWYWSLLSAESWNSTLNRKIKESDLIYLELNYFKRCWTPVTKIIINDEKYYNWVFLDIVESDKWFVNWYWLELSDSEFEMLTKRESAYNMIDITKFISQKKAWYIYYTSYINDKNKYYDYDNLVIPKKYHDLINSILDLKDKEFKIKYESSIESHNYKIIDWNYDFWDPIINFYTWHSNNKTNIK